MSATPKDNKDVEVLRKMLTVHLDYELFMLQMTAPAIGGGSWLNFAVLESFLVHVRNLRDFFYGREKAGFDDVLAIQYFHNADTWTNERPCEKTLTTYDEGDWSFLMNKHLAHITWERDTLTPDFEWKIAAMRDDLLRVWKEFERLSRQDRPEIWVGVKEPTPTPGQ